jgi:hypothetical protein
MATFSELNSILTDTTPGAQQLREEVRMACLIAANAILRNTDTADPPWNAGNHEQRLQWATSFLRSPTDITAQMFGIVIAENNGASVSNIISASDTVILSNVEESIDSLASAMVSGG